MMKILYSLLAASTLFTSLLACTGEPEPKKCKKIRNENLVEEGPFVILQSREGQDFRLPERIARFSGTLNNLMEDAGTTLPLPLPNVSGATVKLLVPLLMRLAFLEEKRSRDEYLYIPSALQQAAHVILQHVHLVGIRDLLVAADYLDIPFLVNAVAAVIAARVPACLRKSVLMALDQDSEDDHDQKIRNAAQEVLKLAGFGTLTTLDANVQLFIIKQVTLRDNGIKQEYSIADLIRDRGLSRLRGKTVDLQFNRLTSLFGISLLLQKETVEVLWLQNNCFYDFTLDVQPEVKPFAGFCNLKWLSLGNNHLPKVPMNLCNWLPRLELLFLNENELRGLPTRLFENLRCLQTVYLNNNPIPDSTKIELERTVPKNVIILWKQL